MPTSNLWFIICASCVDYGARVSLICSPEKLNNNNSFCVRFRVVSNFHIKLIAVFTHDTSTAARRRIWMSCCVVSLRYAHAVVTAATELYFFFIIYEFYFYDICIYMVVVVVVVVFFLCKLVNYISGSWICDATRFFTFDELNCAGSNICIDICIHWNKVLYKYAN